MKHFIILFLLKSAAGLKLREDRNVELRRISKIRNKYVENSTLSKDFEEIVEAFNELQTHLPKPQKQVKKIYYWHAAKTGSSFFTTLFHYACPRLPEERREKPCSSRMPPEDDLKFLWQDVERQGDLRTEYCDTDFVRCCFHEPYQYEKNVASMGLIREPIQRQISAFHFGLHGAGDELKEEIAKYKHDKDDRDPYFIFANSSQTKGYLVKHLNGLESDNGRHIYFTELPTGKQIERAIRAIQTEFKFVGLTDDWVTTVTLFHGLFGGEITTGEFFNVRPTPELTDGEMYKGRKIYKGSKAKMREALRSRNWKDEVDQPLFDAGMQRIRTQVNATFGSACGKKQLMRNKLCIYLAGKGMLESNKYKEMNLAVIKKNKMVPNWSYTIGGL